MVRGRDGRRRTRKSSVYIGTYTDADISRKVNMLGVGIYRGAEGYWLCYHFAPFLRKLVKRKIHCSLNVFSSLHMYSVP